MNLSIIIEAIDRVTTPVRGIAARLRATLDGLGLSRVREALGGVVGGVDRVIGEVARLGRTAVLAGGIAVGALAGIAGSAINAGDEALKAAQSVGLSAERWQRYAYAADLAGVGSDQARQALQELGKQVTDAVSGNEQLAATFRDMGVDLRDSEGRLRAVDDILADVSDAFQRAPDGPRKTRVAMQLLGGEGAKLIPLLNGGSQALREAGDEAERLGLVISGKTAAQMEGFNDNVSRLRGFLVGLRNSIAEQLIPVIAPLLERFTAWAVANRELIATRIVDWIEAVPPVIEALAARVTDLYDVLQPVSGWLAAAVDYIDPFNAALTALGVLIVGKTIVALVQLGGALVTLGGVLLATPIGWFLGAVALIAGAAYLIWHNWEPISAWFAGLWQQLQDAGAAFVAWIEGVFLGGWAAAAAALMSAWRPIATWSADLWASVRAVFQGFVDYVSGPFNGALTAAAETVWEAIRPIVETIAAAFERVSGIAGRVADLGRSVAGGIAGATGGLLSRAGAVLGLSSPAEAAAPADAAAPIGAASVRPALQRVETGGELTIRVEQDGRARVTDMRPANPAEDWRIERGLSLAGVP